MSRFILDGGLVRGLAIAMTVALGVTAACGEVAREPARANGEGRASAMDTSATERPITRTDTVSLEGMREPMALRLFRTPENFPLPFTAYVPEDMDPRADASDGTAHFTAEFGGVRNEDAFVHLFVFPEGTPLPEAVATARGYTAGRSGIPVSRGVEPVTDDNPPPDLDWALESFRFHYQGAGPWYAGAVAVGRHDQRHFMIVRHYPVEYADGFGPRAGLVLETWRWAGGSPLRAAQGSER